MGIVRRVGVVAIILAAGAVAYIAYAAGEAGPMLVFGHGDANRAAADAWLQIPWHSALALGVAVAGLTGIRNLAWRASSFGTVLLAVWAAALVLLGLSSLGDYSDVLDVVVSASLLLLYCAASILSAWSRSTSQSGQKGRSYAASDETS